MRRDDKLLRGWMPRASNFSLGSGLGNDDDLGGPTYEEGGNRFRPPIDIPRNPRPTIPPWPQKEFPTHIKTSPTRKKSPAAIALKEKRPQRTAEEARVQYKSSIGDWWNAPNLPFLLEMRREQEGGDSNNWIPYITNEIEARAFMERVGISPEALYTNRIIDLNTYYALRPDYKNRSW